MLTRVVSTCAASRCHAIKNLFVISSRVNVIQTALRLQSNAAAPVHGEGAALVSYVRNHIPKHALHDHSSTQAVAQFRALALKADPTAAIALLAFLPRHVRTADVLQAALRATVSSARVSSGGTHDRSPAVHEMRARLVSLPAFRDMVSECLHCADGAVCEMESLAVGGQAASTQNQPAASSQIGFQHVDLPRMLAVIVRITAGTQEHSAALAACDILLRIMRASAVESPLSAVQVSTLLDALSEGTCSNCLEEKHREQAYALLGNGAKEKLTGLSSHPAVQELVSLLPIMRWDRFHETAGFGQQLRNGHVAQAAWAVHNLMQSKAIPLPVVVLDKFRRGIIKRFETAVGETEKTLLAQSRRGRDYLNASGHNRAGVLGIQKRQGQEGRGRAPGTGLLPYMERENRQIAMALFAFAKIDRFQDPAAVKSTWRHIGHVFAVQPACTVVMHHALSKPAGVLDFVRVMVHILGETGSDGPSVCVSALRPVIISALCIPIHLWNDEARHMSAALSSLGKDSPAALMWIVHQVCMRQLRTPEEEDNRHKAGLYGRNRPILFRDSAARFVPNAVLALERAFKRCRIITPLLVMRLADYVMFEPSGSSAWNPPDLAIFAAWVARSEVGHEKRVDGSQGSPIRHDAFFAWLANKIQPTDLIPEEVGVTETRSLDGEVASTNSQAERDHSGRPATLLYLSSYFFAFAVSRRVSTHANHLTRIVQALNTLAPQHLAELSSMDNASTLRNLYLFELTVEALKARVARIELKGESAKRIRNRSKDSKETKEDVSKRHAQVLLTAADLKAIPSLPRVIVDAGRVLTQAQERLQRGNSHADMFVRLALAAEAAVDAPVEALSVENAVRGSMHANERRVFDVFLAMRSISRTLGLRAPTLHHMTQQGFQLDVAIEFDEANPAPEGLPRGTRGIGVLVRERYGVVGAPLDDFPDFSSNKWRPTAEEADFLLKEGPGKQLSWSSLPYADVSCMRASAFLSHEAASPEREARAFIMQSAGWIITDIRRQSWQDQKWAFYIQQTLRRRAESRAAAPSPLHDGDAPGSAPVTPADAHRGPRSHIVVWKEKDAQQSLETFILRNLGAAGLRVKKDPAAAFEGVVHTSAT